MKKLCLLAVTLCISLVCANARDSKRKPIEASNNYVTTQISSDYFNRIEASGIVEVVYGQTDDATSSVELYAPDNLTDAIEVRVADNKLTVGIKNNTSVTGKDLRIIVRATSPALVSVNTSGVARTTIEGALKWPEVRLTAAGASTISIKELVADKIYLTTSGTSCVKTDLVECGSVAMSCAGGSVASLTGSAEKATIKASGTSRINSENLVAGDVSVKATGAAGVRCHAAVSLVAEASGTSRLQYKGTPVLKIRKGDVSTVAKL